jgi:hypothetical protein
VKEKRRYQDLGLERDRLVHVPKVCAGCCQHRQLTFHHLIPKKLHRRAHFRRRYTKAELNVGIEVCRDCHKGIHRLYDEMTLAKQFGSSDRLLGDPALQKHFAWVSKLRISPLGCSPSNIRRRHK